MQEKYKICTKCNENLKIDQYFKRSKGKDGLSSWCMKCYKDYSKKWYIINKEKSIEYTKQYRKNNLEEIKVKDSLRKEIFNKDPENVVKHKSTHLQNKYNLTLDQYLNLCIQQNDCCKICSKHKDQIGKLGLVVDHDHNSGKVRGILCNNCNLILGYAKDDTNTLLKCIDYLRNSEEHEDVS